MRLAPLALALALLSPAARAQPAPAYTAPSWGAPVPLDGDRPPDAGVVRSLRAPVDVHLTAGVDPALAPVALRLAERAMDELQFVLQWPLPLPDGDRGGSPSLDLYLTADGPPSVTVVDSLCPDTLWTRATAFARVRATTDREALYRAVAEAVARASILGENAESAPAASAAMAASLARSLTRQPADLDAVRELQRTPWRALAWGDDTSHARGDALFFDWLSSGWGGPTRPLLRGLVASPVQRTPASAPTLWGEPDLFDVAARVFRDEPGGFDLALLTFAKARATLGSDASLTGYADRTLSVEPARTVRWSQLPAWTMGPHAMEPGGLGVVAIDLNDAPTRGEPALAVWVHAAPELRWMASAVRLAPDGHPLGAVDSEVITNGEWSAQVESLEGVARVLVVLTCLGERRLDPEAPLPTRGWWSINAARG